MSLILFHAGHNKLSLVTQHAFSGEDGWDYRVGGDALSHFEIAECEVEGLEFQMMRWSGGAEGRIMMRGSGRRYVFFAVIAGSCRIGWDGAGRLFHERAANMLDGITGFVPLERVLTGQLVFVRMSFDEPAVVQRRFESRGWCFATNLLVTKVMLDLLSPLTMERGIMPHTDALRINIQATIGHLFSSAPLIYQRSKAGAGSAAWFYEQKARLSNEAAFTGEFSQLMARAGVDNIVRFRRLLKQLYDYRVRDLLREQRMMIAVRLLCDTDFSIKEVAALSGYKNVFYFTRVFSDYFHEPPAAFRRRHLR